MYGASSAIVVSGLTPLARRVKSRTRALNPSRAFDAIAHLTSGSAVKGEAEKHSILRLRYRTLGRIDRELELCRDESPDALPSPGDLPARCGRCCRPRMEQSDVPRHQTTRC